MGCWKLAKQARVAGAWRAGGRVWEKWSERVAEGQALTALLGHRRTLTFTLRETGQDGTHLRVSRGGALILLCVEKTGGRRGESAEGEQVLSISSGRCWQLEVELQPW